jgi:outer membrane protein OmpA-like peptidoglycan-associated protein
MKYYENSMKKKAIIFIVFAVLFAQNALCQFPDYRKTNLGLYLAPNFNMHSPNFNMDSIASVTDNKTTTGIAVGAIFNYPVSDMITLSGRFGYNDLSGTLDGKNPLSQELSFDAGLSYLEITPAVNLFNIIPVERLYLLAGLELGIPLSPKYEISFSSTNALIELPDPNVRIAAAIGAGYIFDLSKNVFLTPEISFRIPFTQVSSNSKFDSWSVSQIRLGVSLTFGLESTAPGAKESYLKIGFDDIRYYDLEGNTNTLKRIKVEDNQYKELFPIIPYVFYNENKDVPREDNQALAQGSEAGQYSLDNLEADALKINIRTLDIIGARMKLNTNSTITITGTNDGKKESTNKSLSQKRAEYAKNYLVNSHGIEPARINIVSAGLPSKPSSSSVPEGIEENRRIEIRSNDDFILQPIVIKEEVQSLADPNLIEFVPFVKTSDSVISWKLEITQMDKTLRVMEGTGDIPPLQWIIYPNELHKKEIPIEFNLSVKNSAGLSRRESGTIPVDYFSFIRKKEEQMPDRIIYKFSLVLFDFDKSDISPSDMKIIEDNVLPSVKFNSIVKIYGYTDKIGDQGYNKKLAQKRAETVAKLIKDKVKDAKVEVYGVGYNKGLFENDTPVGRHLSRTVQILVESPK